MAEVGKTLKSWISKLVAPDEIEEPETIQDEAVTKILDEGTKNAGKGIFEEVKGYTPKDNPAIVFVDPKTLEDEPIEDKDKFINETKKKNKTNIVDEDTFERLEREEEELESNSRGQNQRK